MNDNFPTTYSVEPDKTATPHDQIDSLIQQASILNLLSSLAGKRLLEGEEIDFSQYKGFDPEGSGYDQIRADELGYTRDKAGHLPSIDSETGMILKGLKHPTWDLMAGEEKRLGNKIFKGKDGRYYSTSTAPHK